jgi:hypothetical protein
LIIELAGHYFLFRLNRELEHNIFAGKRFVNGRESLQLSLDIDLVLRIKEDFKELASIKTATGALADNFSRVD